MWFVLVLCLGKSRMVAMAAVRRASDTIATIAAINPKKAHPSFENLFASLFFVVVLSVFKVLTLSGSCSDPKSIAELEHRIPRSIKGLKDIEGALNDRFPWRIQLVKLRSYCLTNFFQTSSSPYVVVGSHGWLYLKEAIQKTTFQEPLSPEQLESWLKNWQNSLEWKSRWLNERGSRFLLVIAPEKSTVYPEFLPDGWQHSSTNSPRSQLVAYLKAHSNIEVLDLTDSLLAVKDRTPVFFRTDSHWNLHGAFTATNEIVRRLNGWFPNVVPISMAELETTSDSWPGDLTRLLGSPSRERFENIRPVGHFKLNVVQDRYNLLTIEQSKNKLPKVLVIRDSFSNNLRQFLSSRFNEATYCRWYDPFPFDLIEKRKPQIVIQELAERHIVDLVARPTVMSHPSNFPI